MFYKFLSERLAFDFDTFFKKSMSIILSLVAIGTRLGATGPSAIIISYKQFLRLL